MERAAALGPRNKGSGIKSAFTRHPRRPSMPPFWHVTGESVDVGLSLLYPDFYASDGLSLDVYIQDGLLGVRRTELPAGSGSMKAASGW